MNDHFVQSLVRMYFYLSRHFTQYSVFSVGNIPYDASEEKLKDIFSEVGPVLSFKLVYDRESGKPKGYGFCEYRDQETASSAMRNLNGYELSGRNLRVDTATNERFKEEMKNLQSSLSGSSFESPYGAEVEAEKAPETVAKVVASLSPDTMLDIARQMKHCVLTNPHEARNMLVQNPQLAYALLQIMVVNKWVDLNAASSILYKPNPPPVVIPPANMGPVPGMPPMGGIPPPHAHAPHPGPMPGPPPQQLPPMAPVHQNLYEPPHDPHGFNRPPIGGPPQQHQNFDTRHIDPRLRQNEPPRPTEMFDPRVASGPAQAPNSLDPRIRNQPSGDPRQMPGQPGGPSAAIRGPAPPGAVPPPQGAPFGNRPPFGVPPPQQQPTPGGPAAGPPISGPLPTGANSGQSQSEQEKAALIMQVLALSDSQIAMLPDEQRRSIMQLKAQLTQPGQ